MTIPRVEVPPKDKWQAYVKPEDVEGFQSLNAYQKQLLLTVSKLEQMADYTLKLLETHNVQMRMIQAAQIRDRKLREADVKESEGPKKVWRVLKWASITGGAGAVAAGGKKLLDHLFP